MIIFSPWQISVSEHSTSHFRLGNPAIYLHYDLLLERWVSTSSPNELPFELFSVYFVQHQDVNKVRWRIDKILRENNCVLAKSIAEYQKLSIIQ